MITLDVPHSVGMRVVPGEEGVVAQAAESRAACRQRLCKVRGERHRIGSTVAPRRGPPGVGC